MLKLYILIFLTNIGQVIAQDKLQIYFNFNKFDLNNSAKKSIDSLITNRKNIQITKILGHSDAIDSNTYNDTLSLKRAKSVRNYLLKLQIPFDKKFVVNGVGENFNQKENQKFNRKVEVFFQTLLPQKKPSGSENSRFAADEINYNNFNVSETIQRVSDKILTSKIDDIIIVENLNFQFNTEKLVPESQPILDFLLQVLQNNPNLKFDIIGHICCNRDIDNLTLSSRRAKFVFDFLLKKGISVSRLGYRGFGSSRPIFKIPEKSYAEEFANRRVEILIKQI